MAEGGAPAPAGQSACNTVPMEERSRIHTERLVSNRSREAERKISFPERGFRQPAVRPATATVAAAAVARADPFGEHEEEAEADERVVAQQDELVQARNPHPVAPAAGFAVRQESDDPVKMLHFQTIGAVSAKYVIVKENHKKKILMVAWLTRIPARYIVHFSSLVDSA